MQENTDNLSIRTVYFDLDGTLADTAPDLANALNELRANYNLPPLSYEIIRPVVSHGGNALIELGFNKDTADPEFQELREQFLKIYSDRLHSESQLFPGMETVLETLEKNYVPWGIITNKPTWLTKPLIEKMGLEKRTACIVCGDSTDYRKPHPAPMQLALQLTGSEAHTSIYIGDAKRDIEAGNAVGMPTLVALYGYIGEDEDPTSWQASGKVSNPMEILDWLMIKPD